MPSKLAAFLKGRIWKLLSGIFIFAFGIYNLLGEKDYYYWWGLPVSRLTGILWIFFGVLLFLVTALRRPVSSELVILICPKCMNSFYEADTENMICPNCKATLENIKGFYERHPELKEENLQT